eukprot:2325431-Prymnesium_polylepis.1
MRDSEDQRARTTRARAGAQGRRQPGCGLRGRRAHPVAYRTRDVFVIATFRFDTGDIVVRCPIQISKGALARYLWRRWRRCGRRRR